MKSRHLLCLVVLIAACGVDVSEDPTVQVHDSSGVRIVFMPDAAPGSWQVDSVPFVDIGTLDGEDGQDLGLPWASRRLSDGRIAISNASTNELRLYRADGSFIKASGGRGEGPGEFALIATLHLLPGDTILVADAQLPRLSLFDRDGDFVRTIRLEPLENRLPRLRVLLQDSLAVYRVVFDGRGGGVSRAVRDTFLLASRVLGNGRYLPIGRFPAAEKFNQVTPSGAVAAWNLPFGRGLFTAFVEDLIWVAVSDTYELRGYDAAMGSLRRILRLDRPLTSVDGTHKERMFEYQLASAETAQQERMYHAVQRIIEFPPTLPAFSDVKNDAVGNLWVQEYQIPWSDAAPVWRVYTADGVVRATVRLPKGLAVQDIGDDYVMGLWQDDLGVEHIRAYRIRKGAL